MSKICSRQFDFQKGKSTTQPMFCLRILQERMREHQKVIHLVFVDPVKAYDRPNLVLSEEAWSSGGVCKYHQRHVKGLQNISRDKCR